MDLASRVAPQQAAVVVIDVQNDFCAPDGLQSRQGRDLSAVDVAVERLHALVKTARKVAVPVVFVRTTHHARNDTPEWLGRHPDSARVQSCAEGTWGADFYVVQPEPDELVVEKHRYNAFTGTDLDGLLRRMHRRSLLICGVTTNTCVETTLRDAVCRDFLVTLVEDCCAAYGVDAHERGVAATRAGFGLVADSQHLISAWTSRPLAAAEVR